MRPRVCDRPDEERESWFYALALLAVVCAIKPGTKQAARGITQGKPSSGLGYLYAFRRVQLDCGRYVPSLNLMLRACKGLNSVFRRVFGQDSLIPDRTQPFSLGMLHAMVSYVRSGLVATWSAALHAAIFVLVCFCIPTGTRKDEFARSHAEDTYLMLQRNKTPARNPQNSSHWAAAPTRRSAPFSPRWASFQRARAARLLPPQRVAHCAPSSSQPT